MTVSSEIAFFGVNGDPSKIPSRRCARSRTSGIRRPWMPAATRSSRAASQQTQTFTYRRPWNKKSSHSLRNEPNQIIPGIIQLSILTLFTTVILPQVAEPGNQCHGLSRRQHGRRRQLGWLWHLLVRNGPFFSVPSNNPDLYKTCTPFLGLSSWHDLI